METRYTDYREKWRLRRQRLRLRRIPLIVGGVMALLIVIGLSARERRPQLGAVVWAHGDGSRGMPRIGRGGGAIVVVWEDGSLTAHAAASGTALWPAPFKRAHEFSSPPAVGANRVVFGSTDCFVRCIELKTGDPVWGFDAQTIIHARPLIVGDHVYVGADDGRLYAFHVDSDVPVWAYPPVDQADRSPILGGPAVSGDTIVCGSCEREAFGLDIASGELRWRMRRLEAPIVARVAAAGDRAYIAAENGLVICVNAADGELVWRKDVSHLVRQPVLVHGSRAYILSADGTAWCVDANSGTDVWRRRLRGRPTTSAVADETNLYVGTSEGLIQALSQSTGETTWRWRPGAKPQGDLLLDGEQMYCTTNNGRVFAVRLKR